MDTVPPSGQKRRRRRRHAEFISLRRTIYDNALAVLLLAVPLLGMILFGGVRVWSVGSLMVLGFLALACCFLRPLVAVDLRHLQVPPGGWIALAICLYTFVHISVAEVPYAARIEWLRVCSLVGAYWAWSELASRHKRWRWVVTVLLLAGSLVAWYALIQHARGTRMVLNLVRPDSYEMRASGTYMCPNHFAAMLEILICLALAVSMMRGAGAPLRLFAGYTLMLFAPALFLTQSRSGWLGAAGGVFVTLALLAWRKSRRSFVIMAVVVPLIILGLGAAIWSLSPMVQERVSGAMLSSPDGAVRARLLMWEDTIPMVKERPVLGHGGGSYRWLYPHYKSHNLQFWFRYAHNEYLQLTAEYGLVGLALCLALVCVVVVRLLRLFGGDSRDRDVNLAAGFLGALVACMIHACFDFNLHVFSVAHGLVLFGGVVVGLLFSGGHLRARPVHGPALYVLSVAVPLLALLLAVMSASAVGSNLLSRAALADRKAYHSDRSMARYQWARRVDSANWEPWLGLANAYKTKCFWNQDKDTKTAYADKALALYDEADRRNPHEIEIAYGRSKVYDSLGRSKESLLILNDIVSAAPRELFYMKQLGIRLRMLGQYEEALEVFQRAASFGVPDEVVNINLKILRKKLNEQSANKL